MEASRRQRDICIAQLCDADEGLHPDEKRMVERRAKRGGDGAEVAVQSAIRELRQDEALIAESVARLTGLSDRVAQKLQQEALGCVYEGGEEIPAAVERLFQEMQARAAVQEAAVQSMIGEERSLLTKAVQVAIGRGEDATMATAREVARHQQVQTQVQGALRAKASLLGPKFDARSLEGRVFMAVLRGSPLAEEVAKHVKEFQEGLITEQTVWDTGANSTSHPDTLKFNPLQQERTLIGGRDWSLRATCSSVAFRARAAQRGAQLEGGARDGATSATRSLWPPDVLDSLRELESADRQPWDVDKVLEGLQVPSYVVIDTPVAVPPLREPKGDALTAEGGGEENNSPALGRRALRRMLTGEFPGGATMDALSQQLAEAPEPKETEGESFRRKPRRTRSADAECNVQ
jgi:hypothetical protein